MVHFAKKAAESVEEIVIVRFCKNRETNIRISRRDTVRTI